MKPKFNWRDSLAEYSVFLLVIMIYVVCSLLISPRETYVPAPETLTWETTQ